MQITITGAILQGPSWEKLDALLVSMLGAGKLTRIARIDNDANYRAKTGDYELTFSRLTGDESDGFALDIAPSLQVRFGRVPNFRYLYSI